MTKRRQPARDVARHRSETDIWLDHARVVEGDLAWLQPVEKLTLWNVLLPSGFLPRLDHLRWLDLRGGTGQDLDHVAECSRLEFLSVNQVRGLQELRALAELSNLKLLSLYGLPKVISLPSLAGLTHLLRVELGSLKGLVSLRGILDAPSLRELLFIRAMGPGALDSDAIAAHPSLERFSWFGEDVPVKTWSPLVASVGLPPVKALRPSEWFASYSANEPA
jgi:hypothetical protein